MDIITLDFETYYAKGYSLSNLTTEQYVRDAQFHPICVGIKRNNEPTKVYWGDYVLLKAALCLYNIPENAVLCHNAAFDGFILSEVFDLTPKFWFDTLSMARPLHNVDVGCSLAALSQHYGLGTKGTEVVNAMGKRRGDFTPAERQAYEAYCAKDVDLTYKHH